MAALPRIMTVRGSVVFGSLCAIVVVSAAPVMGAADSSQDLPTAAVFRIEANAGFGTGFLVDSRGLVLTSYHLVASSRYIGVQITSELKYPGELLAADETHDLAVVRIHAGAVGGLDPLPIPDALPGSGRVAVRERVFAIGDPLSRGPTVEPGTLRQVGGDLVYTGVAFEPTDAGGPVLDRNGEVLGIRTTTPDTGSGPGGPRVIPIETARAILAEARVRLFDTSTPPHQLLPVKPASPYPARALVQSATRDRDWSRYQVDDRRFDVRFLTPAVGHSAGGAFPGRADRQPSRVDPSRSPARAWLRYAEADDAVVILHVKPRGRRDDDSGTGVRDVMLARDGAVVQPIFPGRECVVADVGSGRSAEAEPVCTAVYHYRPDAFDPAARYELRIYPEGEPEDPRIVPLDPDLIDLLCRDFVPYFEALANDGHGNPVCETVRETRDST